MIGADNTELDVERSAVSAVLGAGSTRRFFLGLVGASVLIVIWQAAVSLYGISRLVLPSPFSVIDQLLGLIGDAGFWFDVGVSLFEFATGFALGGVLGVLVGLAMAELPRLRWTLHPLVEGFRFIVPFAWISLTILWFGISFWGKLLLVAYAVFFIMVISTKEAIRNVDRTLSNAATVLGMSRRERALQVHLRAAGPTIASAARAAAAIGWIAVVAAEYVGSNAGLGNLVINAATSVETSVVIAGMLVIGFIGAGISAVIGWVSRSRLSYDL